MKRLLVNTLIVILALVAVATFGASLFADLRRDVPGIMPVLAFGCSAFIVVLILRRLGLRGRRVKHQIDGASENSFRLNPSTGAPMMRNSVVDITGVAQGDTRRDT